MLTCPFLACLPQCWELSAFHNQQLKTPRSCALDLYVLEGTFMVTTCDALGWVTSHRGWHPVKSLPPCTLKMNATLSWTFPWETKTWLRCSSGWWFGESGWELPSEKNLKTEKNASSILWHPSPRNISWYLFILAEMDVHTSATILQDI